MSGCISQVLHAFCFCCQVTLPKLRWCRNWIRHRGIDLDFGGTDGFKEAMEEPDIKQYNPAQSINVSTLTSPHYSHPSSLVQMYNQWRRENHWVFWEINFILLSCCKDGYCFFLSRRFSPVRCCSSSSSLSAMTIPTSSLSHYSPVRNLITTDLFLGFQQHWNVLRLYKDGEYQW